ncbi:Pfk1 phosphofructokinase alpha subinit [Candida orthopsilosis Co 90-125]|uniref:ATP-dependent 6-phosphofructokinase n=1 Tax=Candida orthopsilosis (strain 90-125) TaxID=1136231 RepID=H8X945_CANO9|nr:Pfk1 phosphofructokinase alpha subinit [Candida orthopsilosis Co 90-125]CCG24344.1 Pfk1 phosphofructokinase alpha subinit [Candida orthopsilosis Co 90-125]
MPDVENIQRLSYVSFITSDQGKFLQSYKFYSNLGFRLTKNFSRVTTDGASGAYKPQMQLGVSKDSLREVWLESYPLQELDNNGNLRPWQEMKVYTGDDGERLTDTTVIKIRLSNEKQLKSTVKRFIFFSTDLKQVEKLLKDANVEVERVNDHVFRVKDPLGNYLQFSNTKNVLDSKQYHSPQEYIRETEATILKNRHKKQLKSEIDLVIDQEEAFIEGGKKKKIAVMTSGGDAPGMNPAVRAVVRAGIYYGCDVYAVYEGYEGLVKGGDLLKKMDWSDVRSYLSLGGTAIGTARCKEFREREGRLQAAHNMVINGIDALVVIGGDGSLTGADLFRSEWPSLVDELVKTGKLTTEQVKPYQHLTIVGLVGSIDNDMSGTDVTIGAYSALERITEMVDYIDATASSHSRAFVVEVMGRHCGWLALLSGMATGADYVFIPERPPKAGEWKQNLKDICARHREYGRRKTTVIVAEGAIDDELNPITSEQVKQVLVEIGLDTRITILGHVQRGGTAVASDRRLATLQGVEAVKAGLEMTPDTPSPMIGVLRHKLVRYPLVDAVKKTKAVASAIENKDFDKAMSLRDVNFAESYKYFQSITKYDDGSKQLAEDRRLNIAVVHVGAASAGLNAATRAIALQSISRGHTLYAVTNGFSGLVKGQLRKLSWLDVEGWHSRGGSEIGTNRSLPSQNFGEVAFYLQKYNIQGLLIIGGFEAFTSLHELHDQRDNYPIFKIPMVVIPATVSNNVPGTEYSLGSDTCMNELVTYCDAVQQSASSSRRRVFVVEVQGGHSGFVAAYCGLITGALATYTPEAKITLKELQRDINLLFKVFQSDRGEDHNGKLIVRNEQASSVYTTELIADIIKENAKSRFETRTAVPGHVQQGYTPSAADRVYAVQFSLKAIEFLEQYNRCVDNADIIMDKEDNDDNDDDEEGYDIDFSPKHSQVVIGIQGAALQFTSVKKLYDFEADVKLRKGKTVHWKNIIEVEDMLSGKSLLKRNERG